MINPFLAHQMLPVSEQTRNPEAGLHIGNLDKGVTSELLFFYMRNYGELDFLKVFRYAFLGEARLFAFVYFKTPQQAQRARRELNYQPIVKNPIIITPICKYDQSASLLFNGFDLNVTHQEVEEFFSKFGPVLCVKLSPNTDEKQNNKAYGWVQFISNESKDKCLQATGIEYKGQNIDVQSFVKRGYTDLRFHQNNIYVQNSSDSSQQPIESLQNFKNKLQTQFSDKELVISSFYGYSKIGLPIAFLAFKDSETSEKVLQDLKKDQTLFSNKHQKFPRTSDSYINLLNLKVDVTQDTIIKFIEKIVQGKPIQNLDQEEQIQPQSIYRLQTDVLRNRTQVALIIFSNDNKARRFLKSYPQYPEFQELFLENPNVLNVQNHYLPLKMKNQGRRFSRGPQPPFIGGYPIQFGPHGMMAPIPFPDNQMRALPHHMHHGMPPMYHFMSGDPQMTIPPKQIIDGKQVVQPVRTAIDVKSIPYGQRPDIQEILNNRETFDAMNDQEQRQRLGQLLLVRVREKLPTETDEVKKRIVGLFIDEQFEISEILQILEDYNEFEERIQEAISNIKEESD